jgi:hypothetical protein
VLLSGAARTKNEAGRASPVGSGIEIVPDPPTNSADPKRDHVVQSVEVSILHRGKSMPSSERISNEIRGSEGEGIVRLVEVSPSQETAIARRDATAADAVGKGRGVFILP